jgi:hypothetical protein
MKSFWAPLQLQLVVAMGFRDRRSHFLDIRRSDEGKPIQWPDVHANPHPSARHALPATNARMVYGSPTATVDKLRGDIVSLFCIQSRG